MTEDVIPYRFTQTTAALIRRYLDDVLEEWEEDEDQKQNEFLKQHNDRLLGAIIALADEVNRLKAMVEELAKGKAA